ncbi:MAG: ABC transporter permease [Azovibrio sp.]|uniref:MlaE family ABC transporter permease n=1 Tax=Azovibrio sp. TaxID=1872673 RepID=UPI003C70DDF6
MNAPILVQDANGVSLAGEWTLRSLMGAEAGLRGRLESLEQQENWNLGAVSRLDSAAAVLIWRVWGQHWPAHLEVGDTVRSTLERVASLPRKKVALPSYHQSFLLGLGRLVLAVLHNLVGVIELYGRLVLDLLFLCRHPRDIPWKEFSANIYKSGAQALSVSALVGFLIGITISYLSALQLKAYGADLFIVNILGISIIRELGPVLVAVLVAGRSGSAMTAQIGVMRVTEEIDALMTLGVSRTIRVVLPKVAALTVSMPLLVLWSSASALLGGAVAAYLQLDFSFYYFFSMLPKAVPIANLWIGLAKGSVFGFLIALLACHFGLHVRPNTESLSMRTTASVVTAITLVIIVDAIFAIFTRNIGMPS